MYIYIFMYVPACLVVVRLLFSSHCCCQTSFMARKCFLLQACVFFTGFKCAVIVELAAGRQISKQRQ